MSNKVIVKTYRSFGDTLVRMKNEFVGTGEKNKDFISIVTNKSEFTNFM